MYTVLLILQCSDAVERARGGRRERTSDVGHAVAVTGKVYPLTRKPQMTKRAARHHVRVVYPTVRPRCDVNWMPGRWD